MKTHILNLKKNVLSPEYFLKEISPYLKFLIQYKPADLWELDTRLLPKRLQKLRRKYKEFVQKHLKFHALVIDVYKNKETLDKIKKIVAIEGHFSELLPYPLGSMNLLTYRYPFHLIASLTYEEL